MSIISGCRSTSRDGGARSETVFSVLNDTFEDDMDNSYSDYIELSLQLQYNNPGLRPLDRSR